MSHLLCLQFKKIIAHFSNVENSYNAKETLDPVTTESLVKQLKVPAEFYSFPIDDKNVYRVDSLIRSNPYNLNEDEIIQQWSTAKVTFKKNRVKRLGYCWHSCFGQFRKKSFRTLYGSSVSLLPTPSVPKVVEENQEKKREVQIETATAENGAENNELGDGEEKETSEAVIPHDTTSKLNAKTDFFKLKTRVVVEKQEVEERNLESKVNISSSTTTPPLDDAVSVTHPTAASSKESLEEKKEMQNGGNMKVVSKENANKRKSPRTVAEEESVSEEGTDDNVEEEDESESPEAVDDDGMLRLIRRFAAFVK